MIREAMMTGNGSDCSNRHALFRAHIMHRKWLACFFIEHFFADTIYHHAWRILLFPASGRTNARISKSFGRFPSGCHATPWLRHYSMISTNAYYDDLRFETYFFFPSCFKAKLGLFEHLASLLRTYLKKSL